MYGCFNKSNSNIQRQHTQNTEAEPIVPAPIQTDGQLRVYQIYQTQLYIIPPPGANKSDIY